MYCMIATRPDIAFTIRYLSRSNHNPSNAHWTAVKRLLKYLKGTSGLALVYKKCKTNDTSLYIQTFSDADFASDETRRSTTGIVCIVNDSPIVWKSQRQPTISVSTTEAELVAACHAIKETIWLKQFLVELRCEISPVKLYIDNQAALKIIDNEIISPRTKHLDIKYKFTIEARKMHDIKTNMSAVIIN